MNTEIHISCLVLCGGAATRMGGVDKPTQVWRGRPLVDHVLASVPAAWPRLISANRNLEFYRARGEVITDAQAASVALDGSTYTSSPLLGVLGGLRACPTDWLLVAPGDTPKLPADWWRPLQAEARRGGRAMVAFDGERQQHLHMLLHVEQRTSLREYLRSGRFQVHGWLSECRAISVRIADGDAFTNMNSWADLRT